MDAPRIVDVIDRHLETDVVGLAIAVVAGGEVRWSGGFGRTDVEHPQPVGTPTVFSIQSVSKPVVATALMHWIERGAAGLDDPVNRHLDPVGVANDWEQRSPITIRQLLTHTAGLPVTMGWGSGTNLEDAVAHDVRTDAEPGTRMIYANWGYDVLGYLLGRLAGTTWDHAVRDAVLLPLGMSATVAPASREAADGALPTGHVVSQLDGSRLRLPPPLWPYFPGPPSGSLVSNVEDLARFLIAHLTGGAGVVSAGTVADMHRLHAPLGRGGGGMGLGFRVDRRGGRPFFCHGGDGAGFTTFIGGYPDASIGVALLMNTGGAQAARSEIARAALEWALDERVPRSASAGAGTRPQPGGYYSTYWGLRVDVSERDGTPVLTAATSPISSAASVGRLTDVGGRWRGDGGMFDGCELDFDGGPEDRNFSGGLYPFEFVADDTRLVGLPSNVDQTGHLGGKWTGTIATPFGPIPLDLDVDTSRRIVTLAALGTDAVDREAETRDGWIRARFEFDVMGFGVTMFPRLGLVENGLEGLLYARHEGGEWVIPASLARNPVVEPTP